MVTNKKLLINYKRNGEKVISIQKYYKDFVAPLASKYSRYDFDRSNTVVCPFHDDNDPSFGVIRGKDGVDHYHCFGCRVVGDFVDFYRGIQKIFKSRILTEEQAIIEIAKLYDIPLEDLEVSNEEVTLNREQLLEKVKSKYTTSDFERDIRTGLLLSRPIAYYNAKLVKLISEEVNPRE